MKPRNPVYTSAPGPILRLQDMNSGSDLNAHVNLAFSSDTKDMPMTIRPNDTAISTVSRRELDDDDDTRKSSRFSWAPSVVSETSERFLNWAAWRRISTFVATMCFLITVHGALNSGYINSMITSIEKRFEIQSRTTGYILSSYEVGSLLSVLFVSYFGSQGHIPRWIGAGGLLISFGALLWTVPHWLSQNVYNATPTAISDTCRNVSAGETPCQKGTASTFIAFPFIAQVMIGIGGSPIFTLGTTYIDNHVSKDNSAMFLSIMYVFVAVGPVVGYCVGAGFADIYVNEHFPPGFDDSNFGPSSPAWIGKWWAGFLLCGGLYFLAALPFFFFPKTIPNSETSVDTKAEYGKSFKNIPYSIFRLVTNSVYMVACLHLCMNLAIVSGFTAFLPKYMETQFGLSKSMASLMMGCVGVPGVCIGIFLGGYLQKRFSLGLMGVARLVLGVDLCCILGLVFFYIVGCSNPSIQGFTPAPQLGLKSSQPESLLDFTLPLGRSGIRLERVCNADCNCRPSDYLPVCGEDNLTYFSPCYAGCNTKLPLNISSKEQVEWNYGACGCVNGTGGVGGRASSGACRDAACQTTMGLFLALLCFTSIVASVAQMPLLMVTLRSVSEEEKAFALGVQTVLFRCLAYIPAPIIFGSAIDTSCLVKSSSNSCDDSYTCLLYDIQSFRLRYSSIAMALAVTAAALSCVLYYAIRRRMSEGETEPPTVES